MSKPMNNDGHIDSEQAEAFCAASPGPARLSATERLRISDHAAECPACRTLLASTVCARRRNHAPGKLIGEIDAMATDSRMRQEAEDSDLLAFANHLQSFPEEQFAPGGTLPTPPRQKTERRHFAGVQPLRQWWGALLAQPAPWAVAAMALAIAAVLGVSSFSGRNVSPSNARRTSTEPLLRDGSIVVTADGGVQGAGGLSDDLRSALVNVVHQRRIRIPGENLGTMRGESGRLPLAAAPPRPAMPPAPLEPPTGSVVEDVRPVLRWAEVPGADSYVVEGSAASSDEVMTSPSLSPAVTTWQPDLALTRGTIYRWTVQAHVPASSGALTASATLKVLGKDDEAELARLRSSSQASHLVLAITYSRMNLKKEAKGEAQALLAANPGSLLAKDLVNSFP